MPSKNTFFAYSVLIMGTLKGSIGQFFNFSAQSENFTGGLNGPDLISDLTGQVFHAFS